MSRRSTPNAYRITTSWIAARSMSRSTASTVTTTFRLVLDVGHALDLDHEVRSAERRHADEAARDLERFAVHLLTHTLRAHGGRHGVRDVQALVDKVAHATHEQRGLQTGPR